MPPTSPAIEDYLKTVYAHTEWQPDPITPSVLAGRLGVAPSSVTEMVKKMAAAGLVSHVPYGAVRLTEAPLFGRDGLTSPRGAPIGKAGCFPSFAPLVARARASR